MTMTPMSEAVWASLEELQEPFNVSGYVVAEPEDEEQYGASHRLHGLFDTIQAAHAWGDTNIGAEYKVWVVWAP